MNSSSASVTRCRNSRVCSGSTSCEAGDKKRRLSWRIEKSKVGGFVEGKYMVLGRGAECLRYSGRSVDGGGGRPVYTWLKRRLLVSGVVSGLPVVPCEA